MLSQQNTIAIATNGGEKPKKGSIRFFIAQAHDGERYFQSYGQPVCINPHWFRSEVCSLLTTMHFFQLLVKCNNCLRNTLQDIRSDFQIYTDSLSMIKKLDCMEQYTSDPLKITMHMEQDALSALHNALKWFPTKPTFQNVYSNHYDEPTTKELTISA